MASFAGSRSTSRIFSPIAVPPGSRTRSGASARRSSAWTSRRACVVLPAPSGPSITMNAPLAGMRGDYNELRPRSQRQEGVAEAPVAAALEDRLVAVLAVVDPEAPEELDRPRRARVVALGQVEDE